MDSPSSRSRNRASGWTAARQTEFLDALEELSSVVPAAARVGLSASSAHRLRRQPRGADFAAAWDAVLGSRRARLYDELMSRIAPKVTPIRYRGRVVGERVEASNRLLLSVLSRTVGPAMSYDEDEIRERFDAAMITFEAGLSSPTPTDSATIQ